MRSGSLISILGLAALSAGYGGSVYRYEADSFLPRTDDGGKLNSYTKNSAVTRPKRVSKSLAKKKAAHKARMKSRKS